MRVPVDDCPAGPRLDAACAEAMGWKLEDGFWWKDGHITQPAENDPWENQIAWAPSARIEHAWVLMEAERLHVGPLEHSWYCSDRHNFNTIEPFGATTVMVAETAALAICRVFLKARGVKIVEREQDD